MYFSKEKKRKMKSEETNSCITFSATRFLFPPIILLNDEGAEEAYFHMKNDTKIANLFLFSFREHFVTQGRGLNLSRN